MANFRQAIACTLCWLVLLIPALALRAQDSHRDDLPSEGFTDTLRRMQIKRAEAEHKKLIKSAFQAAEIAGTLSDNAHSGKLERAAEKKLREIEKAAKQIRNNVGGTTDEKDFESPRDLETAIRRLNDTTKLLSQQMEKTSRHIVSAAVLLTTNEMLRLVKILREYIS